MATNEQPLPPQGVPGDGGDDNNKLSAFQTASAVSRGLSNESEAVGSFIGTPKWE